MNEFECNNSNENQICNADCRAQCRPRIEGQRCDTPIRKHYFPNFHHIKYEAEDGRTTYTDAVR